MISSKIFNKFINHKWLDNNLIQRISSRKYLKANILTTFQNNTLNLTEKQFLNNKHRHSRLVKK